MADDIVKQLRAALALIRDGRIPQGMSPALFAERVLAGASAPASEGLDLRGLWGFMRDTLAQGAVIERDHRDRSYNEFAARLDSAAHERVARFERTYERAADQPAAPQCSPPCPPHLCAAMLGIGACGLASQTAGGSDAAS